MATTTSSSSPLPPPPLISRAISSISPFTSAFSLLKGKSSAAAAGVSTKTSSSSPGGHLTPLCSSADYINNLVATGDAHKLRVEIEKILRRLDLNLENEYLLFQQKVIDLLDNHFSLFMQFQIKVIEELNKVGIAQIEEVPLEFYQVLNASEVEQDNADLIKDIIDEDLH